MSFGTYTKQYVSTVNFLDRREIYQHVLDITREKTSFVDLMELMGRSVPTDMPTYHNHWNQELFDNVTATAVSDTSGGTDGSRWTVTLSAGDYALCQAGMLVMCPNKKVGYIRSLLGSNQIDVYAVEGDGGGTDLELAISDKLALFSDARGEGSAGPDNDKRTLTTTNTNQVHIFKSATKTTDIQRASKVEVMFEGRPYYFIKAQHDALMKHKAKVSMGLMFSRISDANFTESSPTLTDSSSNPIQTTRGLNQYVEDYGIGLGGTNAVSLATYAELCRSLTTERCPEEYLALQGIEGSIGHTDAFGANTNSSVFSPNAELQINGKTLDLNMTRLSVYGFNFMLKQLPIVDHKNLFNFTGSAGFEKRIWYIPNDKITADVGGEATDRIRCRYLEDFGPGAFDHRYREILTGGLAPIPTNDTSELKITYESRQGLEVFGPQHFAYIDLP